MGKIATFAKVLLSQLFWHLCRSMGNLSMTNLSVSEIYALCLKNNCTGKHNENMGKWDVHELSGEGLLTGVEITNDFASPKPSPAWATSAQKLETCSITHDFRQLNGVRESFLSTSVGLNLLQATELVLLLPGSCSGWVFSAAWLPTLVKKVPNEASQVQGLPEPSLLSTFLLKELSYGTFQSQRKL